MSTAFKKTRASLHKYFSGYYNLLLLMLVLLFILRPYDYGHLYLAFWKLLLTTTLLSAIFNCNHKPKVKMLASILAAPAILFSWMNLLHHEELLFVLNVAFTIVFMTICAGSVLYDVVLKARVTLETLRGVICAYFMIAFVFAYAYYLIEYLMPNSFHFTSKSLSIFSYTQYISEMLYFSFVTLLTIGYGDIVAIREVGQTASVIEGIIGQFYVAILVARLVSVYSFYSDKRLIQTIEKDIGFPLKKPHENP